MTTVAILPVESEAGTTTFQAVSGRRIAEGKTAGQALDALTAQFPDVGTESLLIVQRLRPDGFFAAVPQQRLQALIESWRDARERGGMLSPAEQAELESLVEAELVASGRRAAAVAKELGR